MNSRESGPVQMPEPHEPEYQHVSLIGRCVSWVILKLLSLTLLAIVVGMGFATFKYFTTSDPIPLPPAPYSPAAVAASSVPPIDYHLHPPPGVSDNVPLPSSAYRPPPPAHGQPLPPAAHVPPHRPVSHPPQHPQ